LGGFNLTCTSCILCYHATQMPEIFHIPRLFLIYHNLYMGWLHWILITLVFPTFISIPKHLTILNNLSIMPCITVSSPAYSTLKIICPALLKPPYLSRNTLPRVAYRKHTCLTHFSIFILLVAPWTSLALTF